jgi:ankyrin repeat protein
MSMSHIQFKEDDIGRTPLYYAVAKNDIKEVESIIFSLSGTGVSCQRRALLKHKDHSGLTAEDVAAKLGHEEIRALLASELGRMEYFE